METNYENNEEIKIFRDYLRIPTVHPNIDYGKYCSSNFTTIKFMIQTNYILEQCLDFLKKLADDLMLPYKVYHPKNPKKPILVMTWHGQDPKLPSILLNSHMDVVPVFEVFVL